jgi:signal transduction histidine kinase
VRAAPWPSLPPQLADTAYRIVQEALTNAIKHAAGGAVDVALQLRSAGLRIEVHDTGPRIESELAATGSGSGLDGMRARVEAHGGHLHAGPAASGGWRIVAELPVGIPPLG